MGFWKELFTKLKEGEELTPDEQMALMSWLRITGDEGLEILRRNYPQSSETIRELERRLEWEI